MGIADRRVETEPKTKFQRWLDELTPENASVVMSWLRDTKLANQRISDMIRDDDPEDNFTGYPAGKDTIAAWRRVNGVDR